MSHPLRRTETVFEARDRTQLVRRGWHGGPPERAVAIVHGFGEHSARYDEMGAWLAARGCAVHAYDQAGHGRTRGPRGHVDRYDRLLDDLARFVEIVRLEHPGLPLVVVGHSMGGLVTTATAVHRRPAIDRLVLSGPALQAGPGGAADWGLRIRGLVARLLAPLGPRAGFALGLDPEGLSRDPEVVRRYLDDPLVKDRMSARFASGMLATVQAIGREAARVEVPTLLLHGAEDRICTAEGSEAFHAGLAPEVAAASALKIYPGLRHEIFQEPERHTIWQDMLDWLDADVETS